MCKLEARAKLWFRNFHAHDRFYDISGFAWHEKSLFSCEGVGLYLDSVDAFNVLDFLESTHKAFEACNTEWGLWDLWLQIEYSALDTLVDERFVEWAFIQHLHLLRLELVSCSFIHVSYMGLLTRRYVTVLDG